MDRTKFDICVKLLQGWIEGREHSNRARWAVKQIGTELGMGITERPTECDDCGTRTTDLVAKSDHHGGMKTVCSDRDACHSRGG